ncbi:hypothetical protein BABINDRAFT_159256 [Babjeviella inositovora NRRL Y-12698]|uniref:AAA+ ATPase domain-containing protein n=1 Tax=Babjeviella inositovora NRRL Y-12698 TaxID=984486 RepID=A0A1E3QYI4_9ASCO|nr:uncharacterized protein BABINDRAFT_159256 [Babjeviella inositovora NRRL Y-12698]ODQ82739.1 hypothetical protein BABINDRAFT_159256 [Babjeviella inositovora NRRL Y-12698]
MGFRDRLDLKIITDIVFFTASSLSIYYLINHLVNSGPDGGSKESKKKASKTLQKLKAANPGATLDLNEYEKTVLASVVTPDEINVGFADIGGLEDIVDELRESVLYPLTEPDLFLAHSELLQPPKGVLLYGPPGCGKTMLAKALARESGATFISIRLSSIMDKWYGESNKIVAAIFTLAAKLQPCIIFIDEIDSFLRDRLSTDHEITAMLKAEFMTLWDGLQSSGRVIVLGATNRPNDIDGAFMRRMPKRFAVSLPNAQQRLQILRVCLSGAALAADFDMNLLVEGTAGLSGSDLKELCRNAAMAAMREYIKQNFRDGKKIDKDEKKINVRPLRNSDFFGDLASDKLIRGNRVEGVIQSTLD